MPSGRDFIIMSVKRLAHDYHAHHHIHHHNGFALKHDILSFCLIFMRPYYHIKTVLSILFLKFSIKNIHELFNFDKPFFRVKNMKKDDQI